MSFPPLSIGDLVARIPIIQGGMGVGISLHRLAAAVAAENGIGVIAGAMIGMREPDVASDPIAANSRALASELRQARALTDGIIGVNIMVALTDFASLVRTAILERADLIFSGAGLPMDLPRILRETCEEKKEEFRTKLVPIISSARAANVLCRKWLSRAGYLPDAFVVEGPKAGGHLGFKAEDLDNPAFALEKVVPEVIEAVKPFEDQHGKKIPVIAAGGVYSGEDIRSFLEMGAAGVQMATRFVATEECDADIRFKQAYVNATKDDVAIIKSPVGMPGRALKGRFIDALEEGKRNFRCLFHCITTCNPDNSPYCIAAALLNAMKGNLDKGFAFSGANVFRINSITTVKDLIASLQREFDAAKASFAL
jgi:NAD(P)H-dependent flavin oxidoreductase YrpB (nitropropane dioxygenase family)